MKNLNLKTIIRTIIFSFFLFPIVYFVNASLVSAAIYYVNFNAGSSGNGTLSSPWNNINNARASQGPVSPGDTVYIWGTSTNNPTVWFVSGDAGTNGNTISYVVRPGYTAIIDGQSQSSHGFRFDDNASYITLDGLEIRNWSLCGITFTDAETSDVRNVTIKNCSIHDNRGYGGIVTGMGGISNLSIINCIVYNNGVTNADHGIYISDCSNGLISGCSIYNNAGNGIQLQARIVDNHYISNFTLERNRIYNNGRVGNGYGIRFGEYAGNLDKVTNILLKNNLIYNNARAGTHWERQNLGNRDYNNSYYGNNGGGVVTTNPSSALIIRNNIAYGNSGTQIDTQSVTQSNNLTTNPAWISTNPTSADFLKVSTATGTGYAKDAGLTLSEVSDDFDGNMRSDGIPDLGARECGGVPPSGSLQNITSLHVVSQTP